MSRDFTIREVRVFTLDPTAGRGTYFEPGGGGHWLVDSLIANPMSGHAAYRERRSSWGIGLLGAIVVEIETEAAPWAWPPARAGTRGLDRPAPLRALPQGQDARRST
jgi:hypothetical protein